LVIALIIIVALLIIVVWALSRGGGPSRYEKTGSFMDFNPGRDSDKVGDPKYPNAGVDSVMKHEFLDDLMKDSKD